MYWKKEQEGFECTDAPLRLYCVNPLIILNCRALNVVMASPRYRNAEPSATS